MVIGRGRVVRTAEFVVRAARLDTPNSVKDSGERLVQQSVLRRVGLGPLTVMDVGAHFGEWSTSLLEQAHPDTQLSLHAFEPSSFSYQRLVDLLGSRQNVILNRLAASSRSGLAQMNVVHEGAGSNSLEPLISGSAVAASPESVPLITIDDYADAHRVDRIHLLKIDAEGHDLAVMTGAEKLLRRGAVDCVQFEYNSRWIPGRNLLLDAFELLVPHGYRIGKVTPFGVEMYESWSVALETFTEANYLALRPEALGHLQQVQSRWA